MYDLGSNFPLLGPVSQLFFVKAQRFTIFGIIVFAQYPIVFVKAQRFTIFGIIVIFVNNAK